jgi:hypothetical protein
VPLLYTSGTARGGTNFRTLLLNNHSRVRMALDPFIPLFRLYRDSLLKQAGERELLERSPLAVLDDYYFDVDKRALMCALQDSEPDVPFDMSAWPALRQSIAARMKLASVDLIPHLDLLPAPTFSETFANTAKVVAAARGGDADWVGFNDNWTFEFLPLVARLIPDARFMIHLRDPRAVVASSEFAEPDPSKRPTVLSFARHLRKFYAFAVVLTAHPALQERLLVTRYEPLLEDPEGGLRRMTDFLGIEFEPQMLEVDRFRKADGSRWPSDWEIYRRSGKGWRDEMPGEMAEVVEFVCDPEMRIHGYEPEIGDSPSELSPAAFAFAVRNARECLGWRTDFPEIEKTLGCEYYRKRLLRHAESAAPAEIERCFLFQAVFERVRSL